MQLQDILDPKQQATEENYPQHIVGGQRLLKRGVGQKKTQAWNQRDPGKQVQVGIGKRQA